MQNLSYESVGIQYVKIPNYQIMVISSDGNYKPLEKDYGSDNSLPIIREHMMCIKKNVFQPKESRMRDVLFSGEAGYILIEAIEFSKDEYKKRFCEELRYKGLDKNEEPTVGRECLLVGGYNNKYAEIRRVLFLIDTKIGKPVTNLRQYSRASHKFCHELIENYDPKLHTLTLNTDRIFGGEYENGERMMLC
tara:strand:- start:1956 stop:2531 length:576 start_codon:yes stop_codon:yes gene_type:complete